MAVTTLALVSLTVTDTCWGPRYGYCRHTRQCDSVYNMQAFLKSGGSKAGEP